jgi:prevent-host-death family protein
MAKTVPVREFRNRLSTLLSDVADRRDHVLVTRNGKPAAALVPIDEYDALEETAEILSDSETLAAIETGLAEISRGEIVTLEDLRDELAKRRSTRWAVARVVLARRARGELLSLSWPLIDAVQEALGLLERDPLAGHVLRGRLRGLRSLRMGTYRIIYQLAEPERTVRVVAIRHRSIAYRSDPR